MQENWQKELRARTRESFLLVRMHDPSRYAGVVRRGIAVLGGEEFLTKPESQTLDLTTLAAAVGISLIQEVALVGGDDADYIRALRILGNGLVQMADLTEVFLSNLCLPIQGSPERDRKIEEGRRLLEALGVPAAAKSPAEVLETMAGIGLEHLRVAKKDWDMARAASAMSALIENSARPRPSREEAGLN